MAAIRGSATSLDQYVIFRLGEESFGIGIEYLQEIIRVPQVVKVPLTPPYMRGLANLRGNILPIYDTRLRLGISGRDDMETNRVIVVNIGGKQAGYIVDRVDGVVDIPREAIEEFREKGDTAGYVTRAARMGEGKLVLLLEMDQMLKDIGLDEEGVALLNEAKGHRNQSSKEEGSKSQEKEQQFLTFRVGKEEYALDIADVQEIVHLSETWNVIPDAPPYVLGLVSLRDRVLPLISMRQLFGLKNGEATGGRIVVVYVGKGKSVAVGLVVDSVAEVLRVTEELLEPVPDIVRHAGDEFTAICRLSDDRMLFVLDASKLLQDAYFLRRWEEGKKEDIRAVNRKLLEEERQLVTFVLGEEEFALPIESVREIIRAGYITAVPRTPDFVKGILNLRGSIIPIIDLRRKFDYAEREIDEQVRILICEGDASLVGLMVDGVKEVAKISANNIEATPQVLTKDSIRSFVAGIAKFSDKRNVLLLDPVRVLSWEEGYSLEEPMEGQRLEDGQYTGADSRRFCVHEEGSETDTGGSA
ncbi:purine-binding chemotaxis protein CheW [Thermanaeromonas toyohensis ToBE]|uniref:Purine-binding chemotaxis protein CheW n=1 Tax=Thermanaeromonas toyohensis ToBE TaxID=698762 RepID=A0A1W1VWV7_9FIRM|nr:chemotaxis protein CheW [Thermanaeromonas toyohensis]SMB97847.1 purine-binding chemotaxis protein CheW [Thermanaeromonas toyohensis ToBE]